MLTNNIRYLGYRFPPEIIHRLILFYPRFALNPRDVEDYLSERRNEVSNESIRHRTNSFGPMITSTDTKTKMQDIGF